MDCFLTNGAYNTRFAKAFADYQKSGRQAYNNTYFGEMNSNGELILNDLKERVVTPTEFTETQTVTPPTNSEPFDSQASDDDDLPF